MKRTPALNPNQPAAFEKPKPSATEAALDMALVSIHTLVVETLNDKNRPTRFHDAANLCNLAQAVKRVFAQRVDDFAPGCGDDFNVHNANPLFPNQGINVMARNPWQAALQGRDQDAVRGLAGGMEDVLQVQAKAARAATAASAAAELKDLCDLRDRFQRDPTTVAPLTVRINTLLQGLETAHAPDAPPPPPLVPAVVPR